MIKKGNILSTVYCRYFSLCICIMTCVMSATPMIRLWQWHQSTLVAYYTYFVLHHLYFILFLFTSSSKDTKELLIITTLWADSADDKLIKFFLFSPENRHRHFMQIVSLDNLHEISKSIPWEKKRKRFQNVFYWHFNPACYFCDKPL